MRNFKEFIEEQDKLKKEEENFKLLIDKYIKMTADRIIKKIYNKCVSFKISPHNIEDGGNYFIIEYRTHDYSTMSISLDYDEYLDLERFVEDPDLYLSTKKFNV